MAPPPGHSQSLLPNAVILRLDRIERDDDRFRFLVHVEQQPTCPICGQVSQSGHSRYRRCLQDLPWQGVSVQLWVTVRRYRCRNAVCPRKIFCERLPAVARVYSRQTDRSFEIVRLIGYVAGGLPGQRLLHRLAVATSADTILRRVKERSAGQEATAVRNLGVDDWAWRKGQNYGTILVDLDLHRVVDLLPDRSSESFAEWLQHHPEVATIARDRCGLYAEGASLGAPDAQQVADRFHLILNLSSAVERILEERTSQLVLPVAENGGDTPPIKALEPNAPSVPAQCTLSQQRRQRRLERYENVIALFRQGHSQKAIARELGMGRKTIRRWLRAGQFPERKSSVRRRPSKVQQFAEFLRRRWDEGCHNATRLYQEIRAKGYRGKRSMVAQFVASWRKTGMPRLPAALQRISAKHAAILVTRAAGQLSDQQQQLFERIARHCPDVIALRRLALGFREALTADDAAKMVQWIGRTKHCEFGPMVRFAYGLQKDVAAVTASVETRWSNGQVEGQINRLKMTKRQMYGRASFELLRARILPYLPGVPALAGPAP